MIKKIAFHNDLYQLKFLQKLKAKEMDLLFNVLHELKNTGRNGVIIPWLELRKMFTTGTETIKKKEMLAYSDRLADVLTSIKIKIASEDLDEYHVLFPTCYNNKKSQAFVVQPNENIAYMFSGLTKNFTILNLVEVQALKSKYSKILYYILKKHKNIEEKQRVINIPIMEFREILGIPNTYQMINIDERVIKPTIAELDKYFPSIKIEKIKTAVKVTSLQITWKNKTKSLTESSEKGSQSGALEEIKIKETKSMQKTKLVTEKVSEDKKNSVSEEELQNIELTKEQISRAEYLLEQIDKSDLKLLRKLSSYKSILKTRLKQDMEENHG